ncbi:MAG: hypothetical protein C4295_02800 [Candidatus Fervidibacterota bacterium]
MVRPMPGKQQPSGNCLDMKSERDGNGEGEVCLARRSHSGGNGAAKPTKALRLPSDEPPGQVNSRKAWYRCQLGRAFWTMGRVQEALEHFAKACELMPHEPLYRLELAEAYLALNRYEDAIEQLEQTVQWAPFDDYYYVRLAAAYLLVGRWTDAIQAMERAVKLNPRNASYHCLLGALYWVVGEKERAAFHLRFRWQLDQYDLSFLRRFQKLCGKALKLPQLH